MASQSFLFTASAIVLNAPNAPLFPQFPETVRLLTLLVPIVAICSCLLTYTAVIAGVLALRDLRKSIDKRPDPQGTSHLPPIHGRLLARTLGPAAPLLLPLVFLIVWTLLFAHAVQ